MKKHIILISFLFSFTAASAQTSVTGGYERKADMRLNGERMRKSVIEYNTLPGAAELTAPCREGDFDKCVKNLSEAAVSADSNKTSAAFETELAFAYFYKGDNDKALEHVGNAMKFDGEDPFLPLAKAWFLASKGDYKDAKKETEAMLYLTADFEYVASARLASAFASFFAKDGKSQAGFAHIYATNPYLISLAAYMVARESFNIGDDKNLKAAAIFAAQSLSHDDRNFPAARLLADVKFKQKDFNSAWQYYAMDLTRDVKNKEIEKKLKRLEKKDIKNKTLFVSKLATPVVLSYTPSGGETFRIALYADNINNPSALQSFEITSAGAMRFIDEKLGEVFKSVPSSTERVVFQTDAGSLIVKDRYGNTKFATKRPVAVETQRGATLLIKNPKGRNDFSADWSDKELTGSLKITTTDKGFLLVNHTALEDALPSLIMSAAVNAGGGEEALKALSVAARSYLSEIKTDKPYDITDNEPGMKFGGANVRSGASSAAVSATRGVTLSGGGNGFYDACFVYGVNAKNSASAADFVYSPANVFKYLISSAPADLLSAPADATLWSPVKWAYFYDERDLRRRAEFFVKTGALKAVEIRRTSALGRLESLVLKGSKRDLEITDPAQMSFILGAGTTRSDMFVLVPFYDGKKLRGALALGADTGAGRGMCVAGAKGLAARGKNYKEILEYYYPGAEILKREPELPSEKPAPETN